MGNNSIFKNSKFYIILLLIATGVFFYLRSVNRNLLGDEILYLYNLNATEYYEYWSSPETSLGEKISTISDVIKSQINHYFFGNGRVFVHAVEQLFSGVIGIKTFYLLNTFLFLGTISLFVNILLDPKKYGSWIFSIIIFLYLFSTESKLWFSINLAPNYLIPTFLLLSVVRVWEYLQTSSKIKPIYLCAIPLLGFILGWSHEAFSIPLSGTFFIYLLFNFKKVRKNVWLLIIPLWIGTLGLILSPANFSRFQLQTMGVTRSFFSEITFMLNPLNLKIFPSLVVILIILCRKRVMKNFLLENKFWLMLFVISLLFSFVARTGAYSFTALELFALVLIIKATKYIMLFKRIYVNKIIHIIITILFVFHQSLIVYTSLVEKEKQDKMLYEYKKSKDGVCVFDKDYYGWVLEPYIVKFNINIDDNINVDYRRSTLQRFHSNDNKQITVMSSPDYNFILNYDKYLESGKINYSGPFYTALGCKYAWALVDSINDDAFEYVYAPVSFSDNVPLLMKFKRYIKPELYPSTEQVKDMLEITFNSRKFKAIKITPMRKVVDIRPISVN